MLPDEDYFRIIRTNLDIYVFINRI